MVSCAQKKCKGITLWSTTAFVSVIADAQCIRKCTLSDGGTGGQGCIRCDLFLPVASFGGAEGAWQFKATGEKTLASVTDIYSIGQME